MLTRLFGGNPLKTPGDRRGDEAARGLYGGIVAQARQPAFYTGLGVSDSVDGRFELLALHSFLVFFRLRADRGATADLSQRLFDIMAFHLDQSVRGSGTGELGAAKRLRAMGEALMGRYRAYERGLAATEPAELESALKRNLYGTGPAPGPLQVEAVAAYVRQQVRTLADQPLAELQAGRVRFDDPPSPEAPARDAASGSVAPAG